MRVVSCILAVLLTGTLSCAHRTQLLDLSPEASSAALESSPSTAHEWLQRGWTRLVRRSQLGDALSDLKNAVGRPDIEPRERLYAFLGIGLAGLVTVDFKEALEAFVSVLETDSTSPESLVAAAQLKEVAHQVPGGHVGIVKRLRALLEAVPGPGPEVARTIRSIIREGALRAGDRPAAIRLENEMGVPTVWRVGFPFGRHPLVDFSRRLSPEDKPLEPGEAYELVSTWPDNGQLVLPRKDASGLFYAETFLRALEPVAADLLIRVEGPGPWAVFVDDRLTYSHDSHQRILPHAVHIPWRAGTGWHRFLLKAPGGHERQEFSIEFMRTDGRPANLQFWDTRDPVPEYQPGRHFVQRLFVTSSDRLAVRSKQDPLDPLAPLLAGLLAWENGDLDRARSHLLDSKLRAAEFALPDYLLGLVVLEDPLIAPRIDVVHSRNHLQQAVQKCPEMLLARFRMALLEQEAGRDSRALEILGQLEAVQPGEFLWPYFQGKVYEKLGWQQEADRAFQVALARLPDQPDLLLKLFQRSIHRNQAEHSAQLAKRLEVLGLWDLQLVDYWIARENEDQARVLLQKMIERFPSRLEYRLALADLMVASSDLKSAGSALAEMAKGEPANPAILHSWSNLLDLQKQSGQARQVRKLLASVVPWDLLVRQSLAALEKTPRKVRLAGEQMLDARRVISDYQKAIEPSGQPANFRRDGNAVLVLDQAAIEVAPDGSALERTHIIAQVLTPEGLEQWGEIEDIPSAARIHEVRTISADGTVFDAEVYPGKEAISLPALQVGDFVELSYLLATRGPRTTPRGGYQARRWYFQAAGTPIFRSLYSVAVPKGTALEVDAHGANVRFRRSQEGSFDVYTWEKNTSPMIVPESNAPPADEYTPFVQVGFNSSWMDYRDALRAELELAIRPGLDLVAFAHQTAGEASDHHERLRRVFRTVCSQVRQVGRLDNFREPAAHILSRREGNRLVLLTALLKILGYQPKVWLARTTTSAEVDYRFPNRESFRHGLIALDIRNGEDPRRIWMDPAEKYNSFATLYPFLRGRSALEITSPTGSDPFRRTPEHPSNPTTKEILLKLEIHQNGDLLGTGNERISTAQAASYRRLLASMSPKQREQVLQAGLGNYFSGAILEEYDIVGLADPDRPLILSYRIRVPTFARRFADRLVIRGGFYPYRLGPNLIAKPERDLPLLLGDETRTHTLVQLTLPGGSRVSMPNKIELQAPLSKFSYEARLKGDLLEIDKSLLVRAGRVISADYPAFRDFCKLVDQKDSEEISIQLQSP